MARVEYLPGKTAMEAAYLCPWYRVLVIGSHGVACFESIADSVAWRPADEPSLGSAGDYDVLKSNFLRYHAGELTRLELQLAIGMWQRGGARI